MIEFILNNKSIKTSVKSGATLLDFIREHQQLKGTKIGCREGDCGACTVLVGSLDGNTVSYQNITSCISPVGNAHGKHIVTIEGINLPKELNTAQRAMADNYATQCGFCTPGFVVSMTGFALNSRTPTAVQGYSCNDAISGNICRCTGYKSIEKAGIEIENKLKNRAEQHSLHSLIEEGYLPTYFESIPKKLKALSAQITDQTNGQDLTAETTKVANGTDLYVRHADKLEDQEVQLLARSKDLQGISFSNGECTLGANTTVTEMLEHKQLQSMFPNLRHFLKLVSSEPIRNMGTLGGNFVNASPIGDMTIFFLALNATLTIKKENGMERRIPFQSFHQDYKVYDLEKDETVKCISFPLLQSSDRFNFEKVCKRTHLDIASVNAAARISVVDNVISEAHISIGGVAAVPKYLTKTSDFLVGMNLDHKTVKEASTVLQTEISPISDVRGTSAYKRLLAQQLFFAHFIELFPSKIELNKLID